MLTHPETVRHRRGQRGRLLCHTNAHGLAVKARRWYATRAIPECGIRSETIYVTGFADVTVGLGPTQRAERWCRYREEGARKASGLLVHPDNLAVALG